jgi:hypothetical protein
LPTGLAGLRLALERVGRVIARMRKLGKLDHRNYSTKILP